MQGLEISDFAQLVLIAVSFLLRKCHWNYHLEVLLAIIAQQSLWCIIFVMESFPMGFIVKKKREMRHKVFDCNKITEDGENQQWNNAV